MKRLVITGSRQAVFEEVEMPVCAPDGVVVKARVTAISAGTEVRVYRAIAVDDAGRFMHETVPFELPIENGYSMVGEIVEVGAEVGGWTRGIGRSWGRQFVGIDGVLAAGTGSIGSYCSSVFEAFQ